MNFTSEPIIDGNEEVGTLYRCNCEVHFEIKPEYRHWWITQRKKVREYFSRLLDETMITTRTPLDEVGSHRLILALGFVETWRDEKFIYYLLQRLPFERKDHEAKVQSA